MTALANSAFVVVDRGSAGDLFYRVVDITLNNAYDALGWAITPQQLGFGSNGVIFLVIPQAIKGGFLVEWDQVNSKLMVRDSSGAANTLSPEITTVTLMNAKVLRVLAFGKGQG